MLDGFEKWVGTIFLLFILRLLHSYTYTKSPRIQIEICLNRLMP